MWHINARKCLKLFDKVYISSDSDDILREAKELGCLAIKRPKVLCGDTPNIYVYLHAFGYMDADRIVAVQANSPTVSEQIIKTIKEFIDLGIPEAITVNPDYSIYGSVWGFSKEVVFNYKDPYHPTPMVQIIDTSKDIHSLEDLQMALIEYNTK